jgi:hypothetical protein
MTTPSAPERSSGRLQVVNALIWALTILAAAIAEKASENVVYLLLVLLIGSASSWLAVYQLSPGISLPQHR